MTSFSSTISFRQVWKRTAKVRARGCRGQHNVRVAHWLRYLVVSVRNEFKTFQGSI